MITMEYAGSTWVLYNQNNGLNQPVEKFDNLRVPTLDRSSATPIGITPEGKLIVRAQGKTHEIPAGEVGLVWVRK